MSYEPLHHKYRPKTFAELVGQEAIATTLTNAIRAAKIATAYLFTGPRGTGKTSSARILAKSLNCLSSPVPTAEPCGVCDACQGISKGYAVDVIEIDAASNTGVDNIREIIERAQFAPIQCRYKVYVIDECLTGEALVLTDIGLLRIDNPDIKGNKVLSYNDLTGNWEYKRVVRWLNQGIKQTLVIKTANQTIRCTDNHLIRTEQGWIAAKDLKEGMRILSPRKIDFQKLGVPQKFVTAPEVEQVNNTITLHSRLIPLANDCQNPDHTPYSQWNTNWELVEFVYRGGMENVYDIEVEDNHNFVANGLLVHNCHMLSTAAFNALLKTLEEPPKHVVFVLATTDPQRVLPTIISRCQRFDYRRIPLEAMVSHLKQIAINENIPIREEAIRLVAQLSQGGLRDAESLLDQLSLLPGEIVPESVWNLVGTVSERDLLNLVGAIASDNPQVTIESVRAILDRGREPLIILQNLAGFYRDLLIAKTAPDRPDLVACTEETWSAMVECAQNFHVSALLQGQQHLRSAEVQLKNSNQPRLWLEVTLLGLLPSAIVINTTVIANPSPPVIKTSFSPQSVEQPPTQATPQVVNSPVSPSTPPPPVQTSQSIVETPPQKVSQAVSPIEQPVMEESLVPVYDYGQIWQQVLTQIEPISRRELLRQMCQVVYMDDASARVAIKSAWYKRVQDDLPVITSAFRVVLNRHIHVSLESANNFHQANHLATEKSSISYQSLPKNISSPQTSTTTVKLPTHNFVNHPQSPNQSPQTRQTQNPQVQNPPVQNHPHQPVQTNNYQTSRPAVPRVSPLTQTPRPSKNEAENTQPHPQVFPTQELPKNSDISSPASSVEVEAIFNAAKKLAEFFDGKIVTDQEGSDFGAVDSGIEFGEEIDSNDD